MRKINWLNFSIFFKNHLEKVFIFLFSFIPFFWFKRGFIILPNESYLPLDFQGDFYTFFYTWISKWFLGEQSRHFVKLPFLVTGLLLSKLGFSWNLMERLYFWAINLIAGFSMYYLISILFAEDRERKGIKRLAGFISALFYLFNVYLVYLWGHVEMVLAYAILPLLVGLYFKGAREEKKYFRYAFLFALCTQFLVLSMVNPPFYVSSLSVLLLCFLYILLLGAKEKIWSFLKYNFLCLFLFLLLNLWWVFPFVDYAWHTQKGLKTDFAFSASQNSSFLNLFRLLGHWGWQEGVRGFSYFPYADKYFSGGLLLVGYGLTFIALGSLLFKKKKSLLFCLSSFLIFSILAKGSHWPLGKTYVWMLQYFPGFWFFRNPYQKFANIMAFFLALLLGYGVAEIFSFLSKRRKRAGFLFVFLVTAMILLHAFPLITGEVMFYQKGNTNSPQVKVPEYWFEAAGWLNSLPEDSRILIFPANFSYIVPYQWNYFGREIAEYLVRKPMIELLPAEEFTQHEKDFVNLVQKTIFTALYSDKKTFDNLLGLFNIQWVMQRNDYDWELEGNYQNSPEAIREALEGTIVKYSRSFGKLDIYELPTESSLYSPHIFIPEKIFIAEEGIEKILEIVSNSKFVTKSAILLSDGTTEAKKEVRELVLAEVGRRAEMPLLEFYKKNPTLYKAKISQVDKPFLLVFSENFHPRWQAKINGQVVDKSRHFRVNGYANAWLIDKQGDLEITIEFLTQKLFYLGMVISGSTLLLGVGYLLYGRKNL